MKRRHFLQRAGLLCASGTTIAAGTTKAATAAQSDQAKADGQIKSVLVTSAHTPVAKAIAAGLGDAVHGETLFLKGDDATGSHKDARRATIAARYCVLALTGDNLGDFADVFNAGDRSPQARRELAARGEFAQMWGNGWFVLPNPVYGASIKGNVGDIFPPKARWTPSDEGE